MSCYATEGELALIIKLIRIRRLEEQHLHMLLSWLDLPANDPGTPASEVIAWLEGHPYTPDRPS